MNRTLKSIIAVLLIAIICFSLISIAQDTFGGKKIDVTEQKLYSLSDGSIAILNRLNQPIDIKLYYTKEAAMKLPDNIKILNNYYDYIRTLLDEYNTQADGMINLSIIDPKPFSDEQIEAIRYGLQRIPLSEQDSFMFGLTVKTQFGVIKTIPFFDINRQNFVEYDISSLIDSATRREKKKIGIISSLQVMGEQMDPYMMRMQNRRPAPPWTIVAQLREKFDVEQVETDVEKIEGVDILLVIHPKDLPQKTLFAIDQFVLNGGRTVVCLDPHCFVDRPANQMAMMQGGHKSSSSIDPLLKKWGLKMPPLTFAGDRTIAEKRPVERNKMPEMIIGFLNLNNKKCFNQENVATSELNDMTVLFAGALETVETVTDPNNPIEHIPLISTTEKGNTVTVANQFELMMLEPAKLLNKFFDGSKPVNMGYLVTGKFDSAYPDGIEVADESDPNALPKKLTGLTHASQDCAVAVISDVDFITDNFAYTRAFFGQMMAVNDNAAFLLNTIEQLSGSADLISIRSRGNYSRNFEVIDEIENQAARATAQKENQINADIQRFQQELNQILSSAKEGQEELVSTSIINKKRELESKIIEKKKELIEVKKQAVQGIDKLQNKLRHFNTLPGPIFILLIAIILAVYRTTKKRHYVSHASDS